MFHISDRKHGADIEAEVDDGIGKMNAYLEALKAETKERAAVIELLDHAEAFYENQRGEAKIVCNVSKIILIFLLPLFINFIHQFILIFESDHTLVYL